MFSPWPSRQVAHVSTFASPSLDSIWLVLRITSRPIWTVSIAQDLSEFEILDGPSGRRPKVAARSRTRRWNFRDTAPLRSSSKAAFTTARGNADRSSEPGLYESFDFVPESLLFDDELSLFEDELSLFELDSLALLADSSAFFAASAPFLYELLR